MAVRRILAASTGFGRRGDGTWTAGPIVRAAIDLSAHPRNPRLAWLGTAKGDRPEEAARVRAAFDGSPVTVTVIELLPRPNVEDLRASLLAQDVVYVGGGSVAALLAIWRLHGLDSILREAWEAGTVLAGHSAGSLCWHMGGPTDSFGLLRVVTDGLGLVPYGNGVHDDGDPDRRAMLRRAVADGTLPTSCTTDDGAALLYEGVDLAEVLTERESAGASLVRRSGTDVEEIRLPARLIG